MKTRWISTLASLAGMALTLLAPSAAHADYAFHVSLDTSNLSDTDFSAPYSLDFQLIGTQGNVVNITNVLFGTGGSASGSSNLSGDVSGSLSSGVTLNSATSFFNNFNEQFSPGSLLQFDVQTTTNFAGGTPDGFSFALLDNTLTELPTSGPASQLFQVDIDGATPTITSYYSYWSGTSVTITPAAIPEPVFVQMSVLLALGGAGMWKRRRNLSQA